MEIWLMENWETAQNYPKRGWRKDVRSRKLKLYLHSLCCQEESLQREGNDRAAKSWCPRVNSRLPGVQPRRIMVLLCAGMGSLGLPRVHVDATEVHNGRLFVTRAVVFFAFIGFLNRGTGWGHWSPSLLPNSSSARTEVSKQDVDMNEKYLKVSQMWKSWSFEMRTMTFYAFVYQ